MGVTLSSLKIVSELDASGYTRGAAEKLSADTPMIASDKALARRQHQ